MFLDDEVNKLFLELQRKNFKSSEVFPDLVNFFCESSDFCKEPCGSTA